MSEITPKDLAIKTESVILATHRLLCKLVVGATVRKGLTTKVVDRITFNGDGYDLTVYSRGISGKTLWNLSDVDEIIPITEDAAKDV